MKKQRKQWEMEHQAALDAMAADGLLDDRNSFAMASLVFLVYFDSWKKTDASLWMRVSYG